MNSSGQVIGINAAVAASAQNIGFAIPINVLKDTLNNFNSTGQFDRPFLECDIACYRAKLHC